MRYSKQLNSGYSIISSVLLVGFLIVVTSSVLSLVLVELKDGKGRQNYLKAFHGAEWALELALYQIKEKGYGYDNDKIFTDEDLLSEANKTVILSYDIHSATSELSWSLRSWESEIIPLFWIQDSDLKESIQTIKFKWEGVVWNIIGEKSWESGKGDFSELSIKKTKEILSGDDGNIVFGIDKTWNIADFLSANKGSYLMIVNPNEDTKEYSISSKELFSMPVAQILSSARVWNYRQNLSTDIDNTEFLWILKYSVFSWK